MRRHTCPFWKIRSQLKYSENGVTKSTAHAAVVRNAPVRYIREIGGISLYQPMMSIPSAAPKSIVIYCSTAIQIEIDSIQFFVVCVDYLLI
mmetsp:Transcript_12730/g.18272  ORF Transcript_12730/g.18272 Transcript_12730/m.18272 type:complete len:91 (+) Transcript_12730:142-414(+)